METFLNSQEKTKVNLVKLDTERISIALHLIDYPFETEIETFLTSKKMKFDMPRLRDIINYVCHRFGLPFAVIWSWMCTDFPLSKLSFQNWKTVTKGYLFSNLKTDDYELVKKSFVLSSYIDSNLDLRSALKQQRKELGLSLSQMATRLNSNKETVASLEHGCHSETMPRLYTLNKVMFCYELHPMQLFAKALKKKVSLYELYSKNNKTYEFYSFTNEKI